MKNLTEWFSRLPTWGKVGVIVGALGLVALVVWYVRNQLGNSGGGGTNLPLPSTGNSPANVQGVPMTGGGSVDGSGSGTSTNNDLQGVQQELSGLLAAEQGFSQSETSALQGLTASEAALAASLGQHSPSPQASAAPQTPSGGIAATMTGGATYGGPGGSVGPSAGGRGTATGAGQVLQGIAGDTQATYVSTGSTVVSTKAPASYVGSRVYTPTKGGIYVKGIGSSSFFAPTGSSVYDTLVSGGSNN